MGKLSLAELTLANIKQLRGRVAVYDQTGTVVGYFEPYLNGSLDLEPTPEELDESERDPARFTLDEVWNKIHQGEQY